MSAGALNRNQMAGHSQDLYVGTGLQFTTLAAALAAAAEGDVIWLAPGTYLETLTLTEAVTIRGMKSGGLCTISSATTPITVNMAGGVRTAPLRFQDVAIQGVTKCVDLVAAACDVEFYDVQLANGMGVGVDIAAAKVVRFQGCKGAATGTFANITAPLYCEIDSCYGAALVVGGFISIHIRITNSYFGNLDRNPASANPITLQLSSTRISKIGFMTKLMDTAIVTHDGGLAALRYEVDKPGTGAQQTIAHGLGFTPQRVWLAPYDTSVAGTVSETAAADATNLYITATNLLNYRVVAY